MRHPPIIPGFPKLLHGGDYNPEQWLDRPDIIDEDFRLATKVHVNTFSVGIFSWSALEPQEDHFEFAWLDRIMDKMAAQGMKAVLATPSGAKPNWMAAKYPEIRRVQPLGNREHQAGRHNHCLTSPIYRSKVTQINTLLAERYKSHPALGLWHISNEFGGDCHCTLCKAAFHEWLQRRYGTLAELNKAWWTAFWSHTYTAWDQIDYIDGSVHGLVLDWRRFVSDQTANFICCEKEPLKRITPNVPVTINLMGFFPGLDYRRLAPHVDVISWDNYPAYHDRADTVAIASKTSFLHDLNRGLKGPKPFLMMESSPSAVNWMAVNKLLRPGVHELKSMQAIAHGSDSVQYFQWRKSRGSTEKFHGAVVDHVGHTQTRVFREIVKLGEALDSLDAVVGCPTPAQVAIIYDWDSRWILDDAAGPLKLPGRSMYEEFTLSHYRALWKLGVPVDVRGSTDDLSGYKLIVAPMLYMLQPGVADRLTAFVERGGVLVGTFLTGIANESDLVFEGGWPGPLRPVFGIWAEEIDYLYEGEGNRIVPTDGGRDYQSMHVCDLIHCQTATPQATYGSDFYKGTPCLTVNQFGKGQAWYLATYPEQEFLNDFYSKRVAEAGIRQALPGVLPEGVTAQIRTDGSRSFVFVMNFTTKDQVVELGSKSYVDALTGQKLAGKCQLHPYGYCVLTAG